MINNLIVPEPTLPGLVPDLEAARLADSFRPVHEGQHVVIDRKPTDAERAILEKRLAAINAELLPISTNAAARGAAAEVIAGLLVGYGYARGDKRAAQTVTVYVNHLETVPLFAVRAACEDVKSGRVFDTDKRTGNRVPLSPDKEPSTIRLRAVAQRHVDVLKTERWRFQRVLTAKIAPPPISDVERARVAAGFEALKDELVTRNAETNLAEQAASAAVAEADLKRIREAILAEYRREGLEPVYSDTARTEPTAISLLIALGWRIEDIKGGRVLVAPPPPEPYEHRDADSLPVTKPIKPAPPPVSQAAERVVQKVGRPLPDYRI